jgi:hypothetical protein
VCSSDLINNALTASENGVILFPEGTYKCNSSLIVPNNVTIYGYGAILDYSSSTNFGSRVRIEGSIGLEISLTSNATSSSLSVDVADASTFAQNDLVRIKSDALYVAATATRGELAIVRKVIGNTVFFESPIHESYLTADSAKIQKVTPKENVNIFGLTIIGRGASSSGGVPITTGEVGFRATYCRDIKIQDCTIKYTDNHGCRIADCFAPKIINNSIIHDNVDGDPQVVGVVLVPIQYGISLINTTCSSIVYGNTVINGKHGIVWTTDGAGGGSYNDNIQNNYIEGTWSAGISTHESNFLFIVSGNILKGCTAGINIRVRNGIISNNYIYRVATYYPTISIQAGISLSVKASDLLITGNQIFNYQFGIRSSDYEASQLPSNLVITNNVIKNIFQRGIFLEQIQNTDPIYGVVIQGNKLKNIAGDSIFLNGEFVGSVIESNICDDYETNTLGVGVRLGGTLKTSIKNNFFYSLLPITNQDSTHTVPRQVRSVIIIDNIYDHITGLFGGTQNEFIVRGNVKINANPTVSIISGEITVAAGSQYVIVDTESLAASDDLDTINAVNTGDIVVFRSASSFRTIVFKDGTGNLRLDSDFSLNNINDTIVLVWTGAFWLEISRSDNN